MMGLTPRQHDLLAYLRGRQEPWGASYEDMREALGLESNSGVQRLVGGLIDRGYVRRLPNRSRAIELIPQQPIIIKGERYRFIPVGRAA